VRGRTGTRRGGKRGQEGQSKGYQHGVDDSANGRTALPLTE
ncbi:MAG: hypothetical protein ACJAZN_001288, partial [Planctomycetota bacterium]